MIIYEFNNFYALISNISKYTQELLIDKNTSYITEFVTDATEEDEEFINNLYLFYQIVDLLYPKKHILSTNTIGELVAHIIRRVEGINV